MRHDFFEFVPEFKLWLVANDMPRVRGTDTAFWRRVRVIPFEAQIAGDEIDRDLPTKLREEFPGILAWAVRGCRQWQRDGKLAEPTAVRRASGRWLRAADHVKRFVEENLVMEPGNLLSSSILFSNYKTWCTRNGETPLNNKELNAKLRDAHNFTHRRTKRGSEWDGIKIRLR
jgi:putative DNA primase/helicase